MTEVASVVLLDSKGDDTRCLTYLSLKSDGTIHIGGADYGERPRAFFGFDNYEFWVDVPPEAVSKLAFALLRDRFMGNGDAVKELREYCRQEGIEAKEDSWISAFS